MTVMVARLGTTHRLHALFSCGLLAAQLLAAVRVGTRLMRSSRGRRIPRSDIPGTLGEIAILLPVLNEADRLADCLVSLSRQGPEVGEIIVIDGGSIDGTIALATSAAATDDRIRVIQAACVPDGLNGKAWQLEAGRRAVRSAARWIVTVDADVRLQPGCCQSMVAFATESGTPLISLATTQRVSSRTDAIVHPAMLTTLVYRYGIPGHATTRPADVQASGQCMLIDRQVLMKQKGFTPVFRSVCEDVTLARRFAAAGHRVGFYEGDDLAETAMYQSARQTLIGWSRSLPMRDQFANASRLFRLLDVVLVQALPLWLGLGRHRLSTPVRSANRGLLIMRLGVLAGTSRAYPDRPATYWLSPLADLPVALLLVVRSLQRTFRWRGRTLKIGRPDEC